MFHTHLILVLINILCCVQPFQQNDYRNVIMRKGNNLFMTSTADDPKSPSSPQSDNTNSNNIQDDLTDRFKYKVFTYKLVTITYSIS